MERRRSCGEYVERLLTAEWASRRLDTAPEMLRWKQLTMVELREKKNLLCEVA